MMKLRKPSLLSGLLLVLLNNPIAAEVIEFYGVIRDYNPQTKTFSINGEVFKLDNNVVYQSNDGVTMPDQKMIRDGAVINGVAEKSSRKAEEPALVQEIWFND